MATPPQTTTNISYEDALTQYYRLKQRYETSVDKIKDNINTKYEDLSIKQKRKKVERALKCIKCKKSGGTFFSVNANTLRAVCGNSEQPCTLDIEIKRGVYKNLREMEEKYAKNIEAIQEMIIRIKLNLLFGYANEEKTVEEFNKYRDLLNERSTYYRIIQKNFLRVINDEGTNSIVEDKENQLLTLVDTLKQIHKEYLLKLPNLNEEQKNKYMDDIVDHYLNKILPLNEEIVNIKYKNNELYLMENNNGKYPFLTQPDVWLLSREEYGIKELEFNDVIEKNTNNSSSGIGKVIKFVK